MWWPSIQIHEHCKATQSQLKVCALLYYINNYRNTLYSVKNDLAIVRKQHLTCGSLTC